MCGAEAGQTPTVDWEESYRNNNRQVVLDLQQVDDQRRLSIVNPCSRHFPGQTDDLCSVLPKTTQEYCVERNKDHIYGCLLKRHRLIRRTWIE